MGGKDFSSDAIGKEWDALSTAIAKNHKPLHAGGIVRLLEKDLGMETSCREGGHKARKLR